MWDKIIILSHKFRVNNFIILLTLNMWDPNMHLAYFDSEF
jgi:hypothetical protein